MHNQIVKRRRHNGSLWSSRWSASIAVAVLLTLNLTAQTYPNGLNEDSVNPEADKAFFQKTNERMNEIRKTYKRPTVGLVLSGGGAKGAAEAGALMYIEELGIPIDLVCGTSAGGLIGGLYAMGYSPAELKELFMTQDWGMILSDNVENKYIPFTIRQNEAKTLLNFKLGKNQRLSTATFLPSGYAYGFNVNNLFSSLAVGYEGDISFMDLPIPFACVSADIVSCKANNMVEGSVTEAMRSTMSIPGLFAPVKTKEMVLVDGGVRNNFPADLAKAMGADVIIGIELSDARPTYEGVNHIGNILSQFISMLNREVYDTNLDLANVLIKPNLDGYNMLSFTPEAVDVMVQRGYNAAKDKESELLALKEMIGTNNGTVRTDKRAINIAKQSVNIKSISFDGLTDEETKVMIDYIKLDITQPVTKQIIDDAMGLLQALGYFSEIKYSLEGSSNPYDLVFYCSLAPVNKVGLGLRGDTEEGVSIYTNFGINANKILGSKLDIEAKLSQNFRATARYSYVVPKWPVLNLEASYANTNMNYHFLGVPKDINSHYQTHTESIYFSAGRWKKLNFKLGMQLFSNDLKGLDATGILIDSSKPKERYLGAFLKVHALTFNDSYYPTKGVDVRFEGRYDFSSLGVTPAFEPMTYLSLYGKFILPVGSKFAFIPSVQAVASIIPQVNRGEAILLALTNFVGGTMHQRYNRNHIPFFGISKAAIVNDFITTATLECRYNPVNNLYLSLLGGYLNSSYEIQNFFSDDYGRTQMFAAGAEINYKTIIGPIKLNVHWNSLDKWGAVLSIGRDF